MKKNLKKLTILHSNDLHGDFPAEQVDEKLIGGASRPPQSILSLKMNGKEVEDDELLIVAMEKYHYSNMANSLGVQLEEIEKNGKPREVATNESDVLLEYFDSHEHLEIDGERRLVIHE